MKLMKIALTCLASATLLTACHTGQGIISVNDRTIYQSDYNEMYKKITSAQQFNYMSDKLKDKHSVFSLMMKERIVNELVIKNIMDAEIQKRNIQVTDEDVNKLKEQLMKAAGGEDKLNELLSQNGFSKKDFIEDLKNEIKVNKLVDSIEKVEVKEADIKNFYNKNKKQFIFPDRVRASHILIEANPDKIRQDILKNDVQGKLSAPDIDAKVQEQMAKQLAVATDVRSKVVNNPNEFTKIARKYSFDKVSAKNGGDLGFFTKEQMVKPFSDAAFSLKLNTVSEIVQTQFGYHIIIVTDRAKSGLQPYDKVKGEIGEYLKQTKKVEILQKLFDGLKNSATIVYTDKQYDPNNIKAEIKQNLSKNMKK